MGSPESGPRTLRPQPSRANVFRRIQNLPFSHFSEIVRRPPPNTVTLHLRPGSPNPRQPRVNRPLQPLIATRLLRALQSTRFNPPASSILEVPRASSPDKSGKSCARAAVNRPLRVTRDYARLAQPEPRYSGPWPSTDTNYKSSRIDRSAARPL